MNDVVLAAILGALGGIALTALLLLARRFARGSADLGSEAEQGALRALHQASLAAPHLRGGLAGPDAVKAARHLRTLLGSAAVAIVGEDDTVTLDGAADGLESAAVRIAAQVRASGRRQVFPAPSRTDDLEAVGAPILVDGVPVGVVVAFASPVRAALVRAAEEVADWCAAQVELGGLEASRTQLAEAELRALRAQISPHFIYNALTAIASFITTDPDRARDLVLEFADFTRYSFRRHGEFTTLAEELGDAGTRVARFMLQDSIGAWFPKFRDVSWRPGVWICTAIMVAGWGAILILGVTDPLGGINTFFPLFGIANQLLAAIALAVVLAIVAKRGRSYFRWLWIIALPLAFTAVVTITASLYKIFSPVPAIGYWANHFRYLEALNSGDTTLGAPEVLQAVIRNTAVQGTLSIIFVVLAIIVIVMAVIATVKAIRNGGGENTEDPPVPSRRFAPAGFLPDTEERELEKRWEPILAEERAAARH